MRISEKEMRLLACVELQAQLSVKEIAVETGMRQHTVRYLLHKLMDRGILSRKRPIVSNEDLGFVYYTIFFSLTLEEECSKSKLIKLLINCN
ncbi:MAG: Lrp/AsnC family transcriptional regulator, partial [Bdellovibrionales bacterium]|nr:Lrp/AsnC family transcriptional regulator [Bdellovibrionales bacterium]